MRGKFRAGEPLTFVADIVTATELQYVVIEQLHFEQSATRPDEIRYSIAIRQSPPPPPPPDPLGGLDAGLLDQAGSFLDTVTGALDTIETLGNIPDFGDPTKPLSGALGDVTKAVGGLGEVGGSLGSLFGAGARLMATIFEQLESALSGNEVASKLSAQSGSLGAGRDGADLLSLPPARGDRRLRLGSRPAAASGRLLGGGVDREARRDEERRSVCRAPSADGRRRARWPRSAPRCRTSSSTRSPRRSGPSTRSSGSRTSTCAASSSEATAPGTAATGRPWPEAAPAAAAAVAAAPCAARPTAGLKQIRGLLEAAPSPLDTEGVLDLLHQATAWEDRDRLLLHFVPLLDDIADPLATLIDWKDKSPTQVRIALKQSLDDAVAFV